jgi:hypothetical protein
MPLMKYFVFVGSALVLLLLAVGWWFPQPLSEVPEPGDVADKPAIRISSAEQLPERVIIDTTVPTIASPPGVLQFAERWPQTTVAAVNPVSKPAAPAPVSDASARRKVAKPERSKKVIDHRAVPKANIETARNDKVPTSLAETRSPADTRLSLLDVLKEGLGQTQAKLMAGLEPLTAQVSKPRPEIQ